jgi:hypothetical protein
MSNVPGEIRSGIFKAYKAAPIVCAAPPENKNQVEIPEFSLSLKNFNSGKHKAQVMANTKTALNGAKNGFINDLEVETRNTINGRTRFIPMSIYLLM